MKKKYKSMKKLNLESRVPTPSKKYKEKRKSLEELEAMKIHIDDKVKKAEELSLQKKKGKKHLKLNFWSKRYLKKNPTSSFVITMLFSNGTLRTWVISTTSSTFKMGKNMYMLYYEENYYDISLQQYHLFYHENFAIPINREIERKGKEAFFSVTPENMEAFIEMNYVSVLTKSERNKYLWYMVGCIVITLIAVGYALTKLAGA